MRKAKSSATPLTGVQRGKVVWFNDEKGFGFIRPDNGAPDLFVHYTGIRAGGRRTLLESQIVEFVPVEGNRGLIAHDVRVVEA